MTPGRSGVTSGADNGDGDFGAVGTSADSRTQTVVGSVGTSGASARHARR